MRNPARHLLAPALMLLPGAGSAQIQEWPHNRNDPGGTGYSRLADIHRDNVSRLAVAWRWRVAEGSDSAGESLGRRTAAAQFEATPIMLGDTLYFSTPRHRVVALNAATGREIWSYDPGSHGMTAPPVDTGLGLVHRGVAAWTAGGRRRIFHATRGRLIALDAAIGRPVETFGTHGEVDLVAAIGWTGRRSKIENTSPPAVYRDLIIVGSSISDVAPYPGEPPGAVLAFDARTGRLRWTFYGIPRPGDSARDSWKDGAAARGGHVNVWSIMTVDTVRGLVFLPVGSASNDYYGALRKGVGLYAESIVCLDARTGRRTWHRQLVHHGLWDYDLAAAPTLVRVQRDGRSVDAVAVATKMGFLFLFERKRGTPLWDIEERLVPRSDVPGEEASPTQPFPVHPKPFARQGFTPDDVIDFTPEVRRIVFDSLRRFRFGPIFTPPSIQGTLVMPGWVGGAPWGGGAYDPESGTYYVRANNMPVLARLKPVPPPQGGSGPHYAVDYSGIELYVRLAPEARRFEVIRWPFGRRPSRPGLLVPIGKPPYGTMTAIDLATGEHRWQVPLGDMPRVRSHPRFRHLRLPPLGTTGTAGGIVTSGGLLFVPAGLTLVALDAQSGRELWQGRLQWQGYGTPMTYRTSDGRQFVLVATGGLRGELVAFALTGG